jgi:hypothetical protein
MPPGSAVSLMLAGMFGFGITAVLAVTSWMMGGRLASLVRKRSWQSLRETTVLLFFFFIVWTSSTFFSFAYYYASLYPSPAPAPLYDFEVAVKSLRDLNPEAAIAFVIASCQNTFLLIFRSVSSVALKMDGAKRFFRGFRSRKKISLVEDLARPIKRRGLAMAILAGIASVYCFAMFKDANGLGWALLACAAWGGADVVLMSLRLSRGSYGDADYELKELVIPLMARIKKGSNPNDPDRIFPNRAAVHEAEFPAGVTVTS